MTFPSCTLISELNTPANLYMARYNSNRPFSIHFVVQTDSIKMIQNVPGKCAWLLHCIEMKLVLGLFSFLIVLILQGEKEIVNEKKKVE